MILSEISTGECVKIDERLYMCCNNPAVMGGRLAPSGYKILVNLESGSLTKKSVNTVCVKCEVCFTEKTA